MNKAMSGMCATTLVAISVLLSGCAISSDGLVPEESVAVGRQIQKSVRVMPVDGGRASSFGREAYITNEKMHSAIVQALIDSGLFVDVTTDGDADLNLFSEIITLSTEGGLSPLYAIVMQYWVEDARTGEELWRDGVNTRHQVQWNDAFAGGTRIIMAVEGATQKNLTALIEGLDSSDIR